MKLFLLFIFIISCVNGDIQWNGNNWAMSCDFNGNDLSNAQISSEDCGGHCAETEGCTHFTWTSYNGGTCWMKQGEITKGDAFSTGDSSMVCGVIKEGPDENHDEDKDENHSHEKGGAAGRTTRYWDCCKASCGWRDNVGGGKGVVKSCIRNGYGVNGNLDAKNGCENGGEAYACNSHVPWAVNDNLAYGFAAAHIPGLSSQERCCNCYKLKFNSGPVSGKTLIVQVINSGTDVGEHQFDLQIPGGGVGIFNGCSAQWGAPENAWGQRYGGVTSRQGCYALPESIRDGCFWRFDWFGGADNPTMHYSKVKCPRELVKRTGCSG